MALVTAGAGPLFGSSISEALAEAGAMVITALRSLERNLEFAVELCERGHDAHGMAFDLESVEFDPIGWRRRSTRNSGGLTSW